MDNVNRRCDFYFVFIVGTRNLCNYLFTSYAMLVNKYFCSCHVFESICKKKCAADLPSKSDLLPFHFYRSLIPENVLNIQYPFIYISSQIQISTSRLLTLYNEGTFSLLVPMPIVLKVQFALSLQITSNNFWTY
jgi:hypothetical protein